MVKYQRERLEGNWLWIGREFLLDHGPMTQPEYLRQVSAVMPGHLRDASGKLRPRISLAKAAMARGIYEGSIVQDGDMLVAISRANIRSKIKQLILEAAKRPEGVTSEDIPHENRNSVGAYLSRMAIEGKLVRVAKGRYKIKDMERSNSDAR